MPWTTKIDAQRALGGLIRHAAAEAAGSNGLISRAEQKGLPEYLKRVADEVRAEQGPHARLDVGELVDGAMSRAMAVWAQFNPPNNGRDSKYLSAAETRDIKTYDSALGLLTEQARLRAATGVDAPAPADASRLAEVELTTNHPGCTLERSGDTYRLTSDGSGAEATLGFRPTATLSFDGHRLDVEAYRSGSIALHRMGERMPAGYWGTRLSTDYGNPYVETFRIERATPDALTAAQALPLAQQALADYVQNERMHDGDWRIDLSLPETWSGLVAEGIMDWINRFGEPTQDDTYGTSEVVDGGDHWTFVGPGPFGLYSEVSISKVDGEVQRAYIEID